MDLAVKVEGRVCSRKPNEEGVEQFGIRLPSGIKFFKRANPNFPLQVGDQLDVIVLASWDGQKATHEKIYGIRIGPVIYYDSMQGAKPLKGQVLRQAYELLHDVCTDGNSIRYNHSV